MAAAKRPNKSLKSLVLIAVAAIALVLALALLVASAVSLAYSRGRATGHAHAIGHAHAHAHAMAMGRVTGHGRRVVEAEEGEKVYATEDVVVSSDTMVGYDLPLPVPPPPPPPVIETQQIGYLVPEGGWEEGGEGCPANMLLPLYALPNPTRRERFHYYALFGGPVGSGPMVRVPVYAPIADHGDRDAIGTRRVSCMGDVGCGQLFDGDFVAVPDASGRPGGKCKWRVRIA